MSRLELAEYLGWSTAKVGTTIASTRWLLPEQVFRVVSYQPITGRRARDVAVYAAEAGPDEKKKAVNAHVRRKKTWERYRKENKALISARNKAANAKASDPHNINPWTQLAAPSLRAYMASIANLVPDQSHAKT